MKHEQTSKGDQYGRRADGTTIIGVFLSEDTLFDPHRATTSQQPQLGRFAYDREDLGRRWVVGSGKHGVAILAPVRDVDHVLKVFKNWKQPGPVFAWSYEDALHTSPLAHESRAYARLQAIEENRTRAAQCHGWMRFSDVQFGQITSLAPDCSLSRWVIVKDYIAEETTASQAQEIYTKFDIAKRARILPCDVRLQNYRGSMIIDLSSTLTHPCAEWFNFMLEHFY